jgi:hypothetical protein
MKFQIISKWLILLFFVSPIICACSPQPTSIPLPTEDINTIVGTMVAITLTAIAPTPIPPTSIPTSTPTTTPMPAGTLNEEFGAGFSYPNPLWSDPFDAARVSVKHNYLVTAEQDYLKFQFTDSETYLYTFNNNIMPADITIETSYLDLDTQSSEASVLCRVDPNSRGKWYEFRIIHFEKAAVIYYFERKEIYGDQYTRLAYSKLPVELYRDRENRLEGTCKGNILSLSLNGQQVLSVQDDRLISHGLVGLGGVSHKKVPMSISFNYLSVKPAQ